LEATVHTKDVLKFITMASGEQCVMIISMARQQELLAALSDSRMFRLITLFLRKSFTVSVLVFV